jgi:hypothetical protein
MNPRNSLSVSESPKCEKPSPISQQLTEIESALHLLGENLGALSAQLEPVSLRSAPCPKPTDDRKPEIEPASPLCNKLYSFCTQIQSMAKLVAQMTDELEL